MFRRREEGLKKKDLELQASLIRFSKFLQARAMSSSHLPGRCTCMWHKDVYHIICGLPALTGRKPHRVMHGSLGRVIRSGQARMFTVCNIPTAGE